jgi:Leucine-rich repeat (LRR) protein
MNINIISNINLVTNQNTDLFEPNNYYHKLLLIKYFHKNYNITIKNFSEEYLKSFYYDKLKYKLFHPNFKFNDLKLECFGVKVRSIPLEIQYFRNIKIITMWKCKLKRISSYLCLLINLEYLDLSYNNIKKITNKIRDLINLKIL